MSSARTKPFLKWAGGKARTAELIAKLAPAFTGEYREPFMGSAAVFFALGPEHAALSDANKELVVCFAEVARDPHAVMEQLDGMANTREEFARIRRLDPTKLAAAERAARVIYLNKTSFRGLWRVNRSGEFNVPYGDYQRPYYNRDTLLSASKALACAEIAHRDFRDAFKLAEPGDWIYADPPYIPETSWGDFKRYTAGQFNEPDHEELASLMWDATERGVYVLLTNSDMPPVRKLFDGFAFAPMTTRRDIHLTASKRNSIDLLITNYTRFPRAGIESPPSQRSPRLL